MHMHGGLFVRLKALLLADFGHLSYYCNLAIL